MGMNEKNFNANIHTMANYIKNDWFLREWVNALGIRQADLDRQTDWGRRKTSELMNGAQRYNRDSLNEAALALNIQPYEILMHPADAMALRRLRDTALRIAADNRAEFKHEPKFDSLSNDEKKKAV